MEEKQPKNDTLVFVLKMVSYIATALAAFFAGGAIS